ncbi:GSCFA domain-containing protein [Echinicola sediminis]
MLLQTEIPIPSYSPSISYAGEILSIGSCFSTVIGQKLKERKFQVLNNPFGTIFNPISIFRLLSHALTKTPLPHELYLEFQGRHLHYYCHSDISGSSKEDLTSSIDMTLKKTGDSLRSATHLIITLGTAHIYELLAQKKIVANCHKQPAKLFEKRRLSLQEIKEAFHALHQQLTTINPSLSIILTLSPVRHIKDGLVENQYSKSLLRVICEELSSGYEGVHYFPSYEIMVDELRDYRFYKEDLIHPSSQAENHIWERFSQAFFSTDTLKTVAKIDNILTSLRHKAFNPEGDAHQQFLKKLLHKMEQMSTEFDFSKEIDGVKAQLVS